MSGLICILNIEPVVAVDRRHPKVLPLPQGHASHNRLGGDVRDVQAGLGGVAVQGQVWPGRVRVGVEVPVAGVSGGVLAFQPESMLSDPSPPFYG